MGRPPGSGNKKGKKAQRDYSEERENAERKFNEQVQAIQNPRVRELFLQKVSNLRKLRKSVEMQSITAKRKARN
jgi:hypothetical protein